MRISRFVSAGFVIAMLLAAAFPASAAGEALAGIGNAGASDGCPPDVLQLLVEGAETEDDAWVFNVSAVNQDPACVLDDDFPLVALDVVFAGPWTVAGGCMPNQIIDPLLGKFYLCLTNPDVNGDVIGYDFNVCDDPEQCNVCDDPEQCNDGGRVELVYVS